MSSQPPLVACWLDQSIGEANAHLNLKKRFEGVSNRIAKWLYFDSGDQFNEFIDGNPNVKLVAIMSGGFAKRLVTPISNRDALHSVYVFCGNKGKYQTLASDEPKIKGYSDGKLPIIDNEHSLKIQEKTLDDLLEFELAYKILLSAQANLKTIPPLDYLYKSMNKDDIDLQLILRYIWGSASNRQVEQIFIVALPMEDERLFKANLDNHYLLWHGTGICDLISIFTRGLLVGTLAATTTGALFGKGIYTVDIFPKSLGYCSGVKQNDDERCFMILYEVALGKIKEAGLNDKNDDDNDDPTKQLNVKKFPSVKGIGQNVLDAQYTITRNYGVRMPLGQLIPNPELKQRYSYLNYNEYIIYDES